MTASFTSQIADRSQAWWSGSLGKVERAGHRELMRLIAVGVALHQVRGGGVPSDLLMTAVTDCAARLRMLQGPDGLFSSDGNLHSPPDSAFTLNDLAVTLELLADADAAFTPLREALEQIAADAVPAMVAGGVHTPNHRWEISAALVQLARFDAGAIARAQQWLSEGVDVDSDGIYSERSANYAAFVSNPSLLVLADRLQRPELAQIVHANLHTQLALADADGGTETVYSRRQDQKLDTIPLAAFGMQLRRFAHAGCGTCAAAAAACEPQAGPLAVIALLEIAAEPALAEPVVVAPVSQPDGATVLDLGLVSTRHGQVHSVVYGGSDVPRVGRVGSGLAGNPTFAKFRNGEAVVRSLRLSRTFFGLGPFRAESFTYADGTVRLHEEIAARYYQPLPAAKQRSDGAYPMTDDGRFTSQMAFNERPADTLTLTTDMTVQVGADRLEIAVDIRGAGAPFTLELALGPGDLDGVTPVGDDRYRMLGSSAVLRTGNDAVIIETDLPPSTTVGDYQPGEAFSFLGGTDALHGPRLYLTGVAPGRWSVTLRAGE